MSVDMAGTRCIVYRSRHHFSHENAKRVAMGYTMSTGKIVFLTSGTVLYFVLAASLLAAVQFRSACEAECEQAACEIHKTTAFLLAYALATNIIVPLALLIWIKCFRFKRLAYTLLGSFLVINATLACGAGTLVVTVEHLLCASDPAVEFAGVLLIFVAQTWSAALVDAVFKKRQLLDENRYKEFRKGPMKEKFVEDAPSSGDEL